MSFTKADRLCAASSLAALASLGFLATTAEAQSTGAVPAPSTGFYIGGGLGANFETGNSFKGGNADASVNYNTGYGGNLSFGYGFGNGIRLELEPGYIANIVGNINGGYGGGRTQEATVMGNLLYDFNYVTPIIPLQPHLGVGVGYASVWNRSGPQNGLTVAGESNTLAVQGIAGLDYALSPSTKIGVDYRYLVAHDADFHATNGLVSRAGDIDNNMLLATFRYEFNAPSPPPPVAAAAPPEPAPAPARAVALPTPRPYEVYFDFDSARLTPEGRAVVDQAAANAKQGNATQIVATGHTDTVGTATYNQALSIRRASAVRVALIGDGIAAGKIETRGVGETDLAIPTADDVNEPRNRRVEILIEAPGA